MPTRALHHSIVTGPAALVPHVQLYDQYSTSKATWLHQYSGVLHVRTVEEVCSIYRQVLSAAVPRGTTYYNATANVTTLVRFCYLCEQGGSPRGPPWGAPPGHRRASSTRGRLALSGDRGGAHPGPGPAERCPTPAARPGDGPGARVCACMHRSRACMDGRLGQAR